MSHISLAEIHCETLKNSSQLRADVIIFLAIQSNLTFLLSASVHSDEGLSTKTSSFLTSGIKRPFLIDSQMPLSVENFNNQIS